MVNKVSVLIIEDCIYSADLNVRELKRAGLIVNYQMVASSAAMIKAVNQKKWDIILSSNSMPNFSAFQALEIRNNIDKNIPFIIISEDISSRDISNAFGNGCSCYISKENLAQLHNYVMKIINK